MAIHAHSTTAPTFQAGLLPFVFRPSAPSADPRSAEELLAEIAAEIERQDVAAALLPPPAPLPPLTVALSRRRAIFGGHHA